MVYAIIFLFTIVSVNHYTKKVHIFFQFLHNKDMVYLFLNAYYSY
jgi:hypothetical protein